MSVLLWLRVAATLLLGWQVALLAGFVTIFGFTASLSERSLDEKLDPVVFRLAPVLGLVVGIALAVMLARRFHRWLAAGPPKRTGIGLAVLVVLTFLDMPAPFVFVVMGN